MLRFFPLKEVNVSNRFSFDFGSLLGLAFCFVGSLFLNPVLEAKPIDFEAIAKDPYWLNLLHYKENGSGGYLSQVDGQEFFFAKDGKTNPVSELQASLQAMSRDMSVGKMKQHPQCAFPERKRFFQTKLAQNFPDVSCPKLDEFMQEYDAAAIKLVFSSAYPNNPGSMFGHTFFRIVSQKNRSEKQADLLDFGLSFAAYVPDSEGGVIFAVRGLFGGYRGQFSKERYYKKVSEYSNWNSRDIWEYELNLSKEQVETLLRHAWEIETNSYFDYYFFSENCAYHLLSLLEMVEPKWNLTNYFIFVTPADSVKKLTNTPGAVRSVSFRPSLRRRMMHKYDHLADHQKDQFFSLINEKIQPDQVSDPRVVDMAYTYQLYNKNQSESSQTEKEREVAHSYLVQQAKLSDPAWPELKVPEVSNRPDLGHDSLRFGVGIGVDEFAGQASQAFAEFSFKFAYHDLLNSDEGYEPFSNLTFPNGRVRVDRKEVQVDHLEFVSVTSLFPLSFVEKRFSWKFLFDYYRPKDFQTVQNSLRLITGSGGTLSFFDGKQLMYLMVLARMESFYQFYRGYRLGPQVEMGILWNPWKEFKSSLAFSRFFNIDPNPLGHHVEQFSWDNSWSYSRNKEIRMSYEQEYALRPGGNRYQKVLLRYHSYFGID
ncbi:MAG: DUF4105 domain-containing protein [Bdellovibrionales bacterium]|nr:DUF4105 domain-containing protein [Bdellovibrionales bacterium]